MKLNILLLFLYISKDIFPKFLVTLRDPSSRRRDSYRPKFHFSSESKIFVPKIFELLMLVINFRTRAIEQ